VLPVSETNAAPDGVAADTSTAAAPRPAPPAAATAPTT
jgi:hypothetical protein